MPAAFARPALSSLPKGVTLGQVRSRPDARLPTGSAPLDRLLEGGFPRGQLSEVCGAPSSGRTSLAYALLAATTARGEIAALVDCGDRFDPRCARGAGIELPRLLWVRPHDERGALRAAEILIGTSGLGLVILDLADGLSALIAARFTSAWPRLARQATASNVTLVLFSRERLAGGFAALCLRLRGARPLWPRHALCPAVFCGISTRAEVVRAREGRAQSREIELRHGTG